MKKIVVVFLFLMLSSCAVSKQGLREESGKWIPNFVKKGPTWMKVAWFVGPGH